MGLMPAYYTTINTKKPKAKKLDRNKMEVEMRKHNKEMRRIRAFSAQFNTVEEYIDYRMGKARKTKNDSKRTVHKPYQRRVEDIPLSNNVGGSAPKKEAQKYTGDYLIGIAAMHKSNMVPVGRGQDPRELATMRRG